MIGSHIGFFIQLCPQSPGNQRVDPYTCSDRYRDQQHLDREHICNSCQCLFTDHRYEKAVHNVIKRLDQHGDHCRPRHGEDQPSYRHLSHTTHPHVMLGIFLCFVFFLYFLEILFLTHSSPLLKFILLRIKNLPLICSTYGQNETLSIDSPQTAAFFQPPSKAMLQS